MIKKKCLQNQQENDNLSRTSSVTNITYRRQGTDHAEEQSRQGTVTLSTQRLEIRCDPFL